MTLVLPTANTYFDKSNSISEIIYVNTVYYRVDSVTYNIQNIRESNRVCMLRVSIYKFLLLKEL